MKKYETPILEIESLDVEDILYVSFGKVESQFGDIEVEFDWK